MFTSTDIVRKTGIKSSALKFLKSDGRIPFISRGKGIESLYPTEALTIIANYIASHPKSRRKYNKTGATKGKSNEQRQSINTP